MYRLQFTSQAENDLAKLDKPIARIIFKRLNWLAAHFESIPPISLKGEFEEFYKFRIGDYRALYTADSTSRKIVVHFIRHRREVYKNR